jgi:hypothetical protein
MSQGASVSITAHLPQRAASRQSFNNIELFASLNASFGNEHSTMGVSDRRKRDPSQCTMGNPEGLLRDRGAHLPQPNHYDCRFETFRGDNVSLLSKERCRTFELVRKAGGCNRIRTRSARAHAQSLGHL